MHAWAHGHSALPEQLKTSLLYRWILHAMYVGSCSLSGRHHAWPSDCGDGHD